MKIPKPELTDELLFALEGRLQLLADFANSLPPSDVRGQLKLLASGSLEVMSMLWRSLELDHDGVVLPVDHDVDFIAEITGLEDLPTGQESGE